MDQGENRQVARDSLFLMADLRVDGLDGEYRIKVRNLSAGGMMGEGTVRVVRGAVVEVNIRNVGWVEGSVAWVQESRFGVAFREDIDPKLARAPVGSAEDPAPRFVRNHSAHLAAETEKLRKI
ncbi:PilZ domain-containing protein [Novosphingobium malaysiense]|uniref:Pilus assembly protein PilZ n=1 Tax=Novosphingobium malaysiense TaxID=1348853 RepID=A0A0B1ZTE6_9SPHN|nr:PilZ domain-containing protein [Novosphingobium malaysiense]KHK92397.1 pilus assembly protein PilZ [Novosphingobium malaysiense]